MSEDPRTTLPLPIRTERLVLRPYTHDDAARVLDIHSRLDVIRWLSDPPYVPLASREEAITWIDDLNAMPRDYRRCFGLAVELVDGGEVAGTVMITPCPNSEARDLQMGWHLHPDSTGHGYATEAARAMLDAAYAWFDGSSPEREELDELWCGMFPDNVGSAGIALRLGLEDTGVRDDPWYDGDSRIFRTTRADWTAPREGRPVG